jgi:hypothetical protein
MDVVPLIRKSIAEGKSYRVMANEFNQTGVAPGWWRKWTKQSICRLAYLTAGEFGSLPQVIASRRIGVAQLRVRRLVDEGWTATFAVARRGSDLPGDCLQSETVRH